MCISVNPFELHDVMNVYVCVVYVGCKEFACCQVAKYRFRIFTHYRGFCHSC